VEGEAGTLNMEGFTGKNEAITFKADSEPERFEETESGEETSDQTQGDSLAGEGAAGQENPEEAVPAEGEDVSPEEAPEEAAEETSATFMVFDSSGTLRYDAHVVGGQVVDSYGNPIDGCYVNENGNVVDAYWNEIDPATGQLAQ
jgi:Mn-containing catalase